MDKKLKDEQLNNTHGGMILVDRDHNVFLVDDSNYGILFTCTYRELWNADIPALYRQYGLTNIMELEEIDQNFNNPHSQQFNFNYQYQGYLPRGNYRQVVQRNDGRVGILAGPPVVVP